MDGSSDPGGPVEEGLVAAADHVDRLLAARAPRVALELGAELVLAVTKAAGVQVLVSAQGELEEVWAAGQLEGADSDRRELATAALDLRQPTFGEGTLALPVTARLSRHVLVVEGASDTSPRLAVLLSTLIARGLDAAVAREEAERQRALRLGLSRYVCPPIAVAVARGEHDELTQPSPRHVSILVLLVEGLATQADLVGPERFLPVLNAYFSAVTDVLYEREGVILEIGLEKVVAVFGAPIHADDATQADLAAGSALRLLTALSEMADRFGVEGLPVHMVARAGVATGAAMVGSFGSAERPVFSALGAQVTLARELAAQGEDGALVVDSATRSLLADRLSTRSIGAVEVQGLDYPVFAYAAEHEP